MNKVGYCTLDGRKLLFILADVDIFSQVAQGGKKKKKTPQIKQVRENDFDEGEYDEFDDFMWHIFTLLLGYITASLRVYFIVYKSTMQ